jgi:hypothetical protein
MSAFERLLTLVEERPLSQSLAAALRIATAIKDDELASWIRLELMGYLADNPAMREDVVVPEYRRVPGEWYDDFGRRFAIDDPNLGFFNELRLRQGIAELEGIVLSSGLLAIRPLEFSEMIRTNLKVEVSTFRFGPSSVRQVLMNIKVHLLDRLASRRDTIDSLPATHVAHEADILQLKPSLYGVGIDLKALWRRMSSKK